MEGVEDAATNKKVAEAVGILHHAILHLTRALPPSTSFLTPTALQVSSLWDVI